MGYNNGCISGCGAATMRQTYGFSHRAGNGVNPFIGLLFSLGITITSGCGAVDSALGLGPRGRRFESFHPDQIKIAVLHGYFYLARLSGLNLRPKFCPGKICRSRFGEASPAKESSVSYFLLWTSEEGFSRCPFAFAGPRNVAESFYYFY
jgi:hypothetical protein